MPLQSLPTKCAGCRFQQLGSRGFVGSAGNRNHPWIVGEGPGGDEAMGIRTPRGWRWEPFIGAAGRILNRALKGIGVSRDKVYITNITKCQPPRGASEKDWAQAISHCVRAYLAKEADGATPTSVVTLGAKALAGVCGTGYCGGEPPAISHWRGSLWYADEVGVRAERPGAFGTTLSPLNFASNPVVLPTLHPAFIMRGMWKWGRVLVRDMWRAFHHIPRRPLQLNPELPRDLFTIDLETLMDDASAITVTGTLIDGKVVQEIGAPSAEQRVELESDKPKVGHNISGFDLTCLDLNFIAHRGPYWDTISLARMDDSDLPVALDETCSRRLNDYVQWKGVQNNEGLFEMLCRIYDVPDMWKHSPEGRALFYNHLDVVNETLLLIALRAAVGPEAWASWLVEHVACVPVRRALYQRGMSFDVEKGRQRYLSMQDNLAQYAASIMEVVDPLWESQKLPYNEHIQRLNEGMGRLTGSSTSVVSCSLHLDYSGWRAPKSKKAGCQCRQVYESRANDRLSFKRLSKEATKVRQSLKALESGFNPDSTDHWRWLLFQRRGYALRRLKNGEMAPRPGLPKTPTGVISIDDDTLVELRRQLQNEGVEEPLIELRLRYVGLQKLISTYLIPFIPIAGVENSGRALGLDNKAHPVYTDFRTTSGRWNSGKEELGK